MRSTGDGSRRDELYFALTPDEQAAMWQLVNLERDRQTVGHVHIHLIPRYAGDVDDPRGGIRWILPSKARYWER
jgi:diadenosine tetraphosphate (Ap4A) HIT family hydrolase